MKNTFQKLKNISHKGEKNPMFSKHHKKESLLKMSNTKKGKKQIQVQCPYCNIRLKAHKSVIRF